VQLRKSLSLVSTVLCVASVALWLAAPGFSKEKDFPGQVVDSGSFAVFKSGQRIATETFSIQESATGKTITTHLKLSGDVAAQASELKLSPSGDLVRYDWHELGAGKSELTITPNDQFLIEKITTAASPDKPIDQPFLMPTSSMILDNNTFVQRELLAWRYLASNCKPEKGVGRCSEAPAQFGVLVPQDRISMSVTLELVGKEKVTVNNVERELLRINMKDDSGDWALWLDEQNMFKLIRIVVPSNSTEIVRE
jgi:hypothetical protein